MGPDSTTNIVKEQDLSTPNFEYEYCLVGGTFRYRGNVVRLESKLDALKKTRNKQFKDASISVIGNQVKERNVGCEIATLFFGVLFIFPIFFMCCKWWRKIVYPAYEVPKSTYRKLQGIFEANQLKSVSLSVNDSGFNEQKAKILYDLVSKSTIKGFSFKNHATPNDFRENQYTNFKEYMKPLKALPIMTDLKWYDQIVPGPKKPETHQNDPKNF